MIQRVAVPAVVLLLVLVGALSGGVRVSSPQTAHASPGEPILLTPAICGALLAAGAPPVAGGAAVYAFSCDIPLGTGSSGPEIIQYPSGTNVQNIYIIASGSQRNGANDVIDDPDPPAFRCNEFPEADDVFELLCKLDGRDGLIDGLFDLLPGDFAGLNLDGNQMSDTDGSFIVLVPVNDNGPVQFDTPVGLFQNDSQRYICTADPDCDDLSTGDRDGFVIAHLRAAGATTKHGDHVLEVTQESITFPMTFKVTGESDQIEFVTLESSLQNGLVSTDPDACRLATNAAGFLAAIDLPQKSTVLARVFDDDGTQLTGAFVEWKSDNVALANWATGLTPTLDLGSFGFGAPNIICAFRGVGVSNLTAELLSPAREAEVLSRSFNTAGGSDFARTAFDVLGPPASVTLAASPASLVCDGVASSEISATVTDSGGNPVVSGNSVTFSVSVLGTANPITAKTGEGGVATSVVVPLASKDVGVPVVVTVGNISSSILVSCTPSGAPPPAGSGTGAPSGTIQPPDTGTGGQAVAGTTWWSLIALAVAASAMATGAWALRRR